MTDTQDAGQTGADAAFFGSLCNCAAVALVATDVASRVVFWNAAAESLLDMPAGEMMGRSILQAVPPPRRKLFEKLIRRTISCGQTTRFDVRLADRQGRKKLLLVTLSPVPDKSGCPRGIAAWIIDETRRSQLAERLAKSERMASLGTLAGGVAHHFNNILGGVATFVDYALTSGDLAAMKRALQMTTEAAARAAKITQSLLSFSEHDTHRTDLADLTEVVMTFSHLVERPLLDKGIKLHLDLRPVPIVPVEANRMHQVLGNLLTNSEEAMPDGGEITIRVDRRPGAHDAAAQPGEVVMTFADNGVGIPAGDMAMVFEPFFTTKGLLAGGDRENPGLGLSVVHGIITEMGGRIGVESSDSGGACFVISFALSGDD